MKSKIEIFKTTFCSTTLSIYLGLLVYSVFEIDFSSSISLIELLIKSISTSFTSGLILGVLNAAFSNTLIKQKGLFQRINGIFTIIF
ncbi:hypothetical protein [uncultured Flavobacterium sp.]|uniref:hypothetical protein n=1 Tax=uncultured Flavobacterium sp. TaxID=165435 RepID=UPI0030C8C690